MQNPFDTGYYSSEELRGFGFARVGENVQIAKNCTIVGLGNIQIGDNVRIDVSCSIIATGPMRLGSYIHIGAFCHLVSRGGLTMEDFTGLSQRVSVYTASDDYSGRHMTNPMVHAEFTGCRVAAVHLGRHVIVGSGSVILPGANIGEGSAVGALSLVTRAVEPWAVYSGTPARKVSERRRDILALETAFLDSLHGRESVAA
jgi:acetyltransferase-like isoleucine patch superfamily enzyme